MLATVWRYVLASLLAGCASAAIISRNFADHCAGCPVGLRWFLIITIFPIHGAVSRSGYSFARRMRSALPFRKALAGHLFRGRSFQGRLRLKEYKLVVPKVFRRTSLLPSEEPGLQTEEVR